MPAVRTRFGLTGNQLKLIAMIAMTLDHIGSCLLPQLSLLRILGRLAMPIYAYMIAEGCRYTHNKTRYFLRLAGLALVCQVVYWIVARSLYQCILVTFSLSVGLIFTVEYARRSEKAGASWTALAVFVGVLLLCEQLPDAIPGFYVDYGFFGVLLPAMLYFCGGSVPVLAAGLVLISLSLGDIQWWSLAAVPLLTLYNGQRGKPRIGWLFYLYYPLHLVVIYAVQYVL